MKTVKQIIDEIRDDIEIRPTPLDEQLDELLKSYESEIDGLKKEFDDTCENLAWYINERERLLKVIEYSKPHEGLQRTIKKALERPHGEWIDESKDTLKCSACGKWVYKPFIGGFPTERTQHYNPNFCAFCGADMRKKGAGNG